MFKDKQLFVKRWVSQWSVREVTQLSHGITDQRNRTLNTVKLRKVRPASMEQFVHGPLAMLLSYVEGEPVVHVFMILTFKNIF